MNANKADHQIILKELLNIDPMKKYIKLNNPIKIIQTIGLLKSIKRKLFDWVIKTFKINVKITRIAIDRKIFISFFFLVFKIYCTFLINDRVNVRLLFL
jgi:hypothetical protein